MRTGSAERSSNRRGKTLEEVVSCIEAGLGVHERQSRNTDFPISFMGNAEQQHVAEH